MNEQYREHRQRQQRVSKRRKPIVKFMLPPLPLLSTSPTNGNLPVPVIQHNRLSPKLVSSEGFFLGTTTAMVRLNASVPIHSVLKRGQYPSGGYGQQASGYGTPSIPQYTQSQINEYYQQYQCYPPQPYQIIPDYYAPAYVQAGYEQPTYSSYQPLEGMTEVKDANKLAPPSDEDTLRRRRSKSDRRSRSNSRQR
jgi:hypothetical protein